MKQNRWQLGVIAFLSGFSLMVFELAAARVLAPSIGSSTYVWTSVIGVIIAALSLGYFIGGKLADRRQTAKDIIYISLLASLMVALMMGSYPGVLSWAAEAFTDSRLQGFVVSLILFAPVSILLGMLQPYLVKQSVRSLEASGRSVANLSALDAIGGIIGTFTAGFVLFGFIGSRETLLVVAGILLVVSWLVMPRYRAGWRLVATGAALTLSLSTNQSAAASVSIDTPSAHYEVIEGYYERDNRLVRGLSTGPTGIQSAVYLNEPDELVFWYNQEFAKVVEAAPKKDNILVLGGGAFTLPQYLATEYPQSKIDVVEIDPALESIASEYFNYRKPSNVNLVFDDARAFLNKTTNQYDVVLVDVYGDSMIPFSLVSREYGVEVADLLNEHTVVAANIIASNQGACGQLLEYVSAPYKQHFKHDAYWTEEAGSKRSNLIAAYSNRPINFLPNQFSVKKVKPLTDNFAPVERLHQACADYDKL